MRHIYRKASAIFMILVFVTISVPAYAYDEISEDENVHTREMFLELAEYAGVSVDSSSTFRVSETISETGEVTNSISVIQQDGNEVAETTIFGYIEVNGQNRMIDIDVMLEMIREPEDPDVEPNVAESEVVNTVTATAYYYRVGKEGNALYRPYQLSFVDSKSENNVSVTYEIYGSMYSLGLLELDDESGFYININKASVVAGQTYSKSGTASYYYYLGYNTKPGHHYIFVTLGGVTYSKPLDQRLFY